jgi:hypothetical protein
MSALGRVAAALRDEGGLLAAELDDEDAVEAAVAGDGPEPGTIAAAGPRAAAAPAEYELLIEAIYEGYRQHYGVPRLMPRADPDLSLLAGDRLYAIGLERLVALGDVPAVIELADVISLCALAHARGCDDLAEPLWTAGALAVGWGASAAYVEAKALLMAGDERGPAALGAALDVAVRPPE